MADLSFLHAPQFYEFTALLVLAALVGALVLLLQPMILCFIAVGILAGDAALSMLTAQVPVALALSLFVLIGNPPVVMVILGWMGYRKRTGFVAGLTVAQISEFSLVFMAMGGFERRMPMCETAADQQQGARTSYDTGLLEAAWRKAGFQR